VMFDKDQSGDIDFKEFLELTKYLQLGLTENQCMKIFSEAAKADGLLDKDDFENAMNILQSKISHRALILLGFNTVELAKSLGAKMIILLGMFGFIFLGIAAFVTGNTFGTLVNSALPIASALGIGSGDGSPPDFSSQTGDIKDVVKKVFETLKKAT